MSQIRATRQQAGENCAAMVAHQLMDYLENGNINVSVNFPNVSMDRNGVRGARITFSNSNVSGVLGNVLSVLAEQKVNVLDKIGRASCREREHIAGGGGE